MEGRKIYARGLDNRGHIEGSLKHFLRRPVGRAHLSIPRRRPREGRLENAGGKISSRSRPRASRGDYCFSPRIDETLVRKESLCLTWLVFAQRWEYLSLRQIRSWSRISGICRFQA